MPLRGVPGDGEVWTVDGQRFLVYFVPNTNPKVPIAWRVKNDKDWDAISKGGLKGVTTRKFSRKEARKRGWVTQGTTDELRNKSEHPWQVLRNRWKEEAEIRPWLRDPEVLSRVAGAYLEGRQVSDAELRTTRWWKSRNQGEREYAQLVNSDPSEARKKREENRIKVRDALIGAGMGAPSDALVGFLADDFTRGRYGDEELEDRIKRAVDPYAPGAGPFAGLDMSSLEGVGRLVTDGKRLAIRTGEGDWLVAGAGSKARFGGVEDATKTKKLKVVGSAEEIAGRLRGEGPDGLGGYEAVRGMVLETLGPAALDRYNDDWVRSEAGKLRQNPEYEEQLRDRLRQTFKATWGEQYGEAVYSDVAPQVRAQIEQQWGRQVDETDDVFAETMRRADLTERRRFLTQEGLKRGVTQVVDTALEGLGQAVGGNIRRAV